MEIEGRSSDVVGWVQRVDDYDITFDASLCHKLDSLIDHQGLRVKQASIVKEELCEDMEGGHIAP